jgi:hypothetical protein
LTTAEVVLWRSLPHRSYGYRERLPGDQFGQRRA